MSSLIVAAGLPTLSGLAGVRRVADVSKANKPRIEVEFEDGLTVTVARDDISREHFCIWFPPDAEKKGISQVAAKLTQQALMERLAKLAAAASPN